MAGASASPGLVRRFGLLQATALNMSNMIGIGPFITIPLLMTALGGPQALMGWAAALVIVVADGLVWSELGAAMPGSGGSYRYLREGFGRERWGRLVAFLFIWQFILSGPLEIASGYIGFARYLRYVWPNLTQTGTVAVAVVVGVVNIALLYRHIGSIGRLTVSLWVGTVLTTAAVIVTGAMHFDPAVAFDVPPGAFNFSVGFLFGLGAASRVGIYDYLGYYSVAYIGDEVTEPGRVIPRSILISVLAVAIIYFGINLSIIGVVPWREFVPADQHPHADFIVSVFMERVYGSRVATLFTALVLWTAFGSVFALLLGYSRIPYAAAVDGTFFKMFGRVHPTKRFPHVSLVLIGAIAIAASTLSLGMVIDALITTRILIQFIGQIVALTLLRRSAPDLPRPFTVWLYPLPNLVALVGWVFLFATSGLEVILFGLGTLLVGIAAFFVWSWRTARWPFVTAALCAAVLATVPAPAAAQGGASRSLTAVRAPAPPVIDGRLNDPVWAQAPAASGFLQRDPAEGQPATEDTIIRLAYDDHALYVAAELRDRDPGGIVRQLSRRDVAVDADAFSIYLDPHHDRLTGAQFTVSAAGVQRDALIYNDNFLDTTWDAVWESAVETGADGWYVEMRIPYSQLRFQKADRYTWGINAQRIIQRRNEADWLRLVPKNESGLASRMADLEGIEGIRPSTTLELRPYATARAEFIEPAPAGTPFNDGSRLFGDVGLDLKYGVSNSLTLDATINPDFGQVEVDPAVVNLTQFETFFEERRPFFTEGAKVFGNFGRSGASEYWGFFRPEPTLFYSRRIGRAPQGRATGLFTDIPTATTILGAAKLVGRTRNGWTIGVLEAVTGREQARRSDGVQTSDQDVEPLTNYGVLRAQRELGARAAFGVLATSVVREDRDPALAAVLPHQATMAGMDGHVFLDRGRTWVFHGGIAGSWVSGTSAAISRLQRAEQRYYQRPDAPHVRFDGAKTSLSGWYGQANVNRNRGNLTVNAGLWGMSPGFEVNDAGYSTQTDRAGGHVMAQYRRLTPDRWTRERTFWVSKWWTWNYGNESQGDGWQASATVLNRNFWKSTLLLSYAKKVWDDKLTRGGPTVIRPGNRGVQLALSTDARRSVVVSVGGSYTARDYEASSAAGDLQVVWKPVPALTFVAGPSIRRNIVAAQYLSTIADPLAASTFGNRYVFGELGQTELTGTFRLSLVTSPRTSLQVYAQPLISAGDYGAIKEVAARKTYDFIRYGIDAGTLTQAAGQVVIDPDGAGPASPFSFAQPDFNVRSMRLNAIFRWEFRPGSSLFVVWTEQRRDRVSSGTFDLGSDTSSLFRAPADDVFLVKVTYWFGARR